MKEEQERFEKEMAELEKQSEQNKINFNKYMEDENRKMQELKEKERNEELENQIKYQNYLKMMEQEKKERRTI